MTPEQKRAIARITVGASRGTGFLVSGDGLVLTALHVIGPLAEPFAPYSDRIELELGDPTAGPTWAATARLDAYSVAHDWVLLQLLTPAAPYPTAPMALADIRFDPNAVGWETWRFPTVAATIGTGYEGNLAR